MTDSPPKLGIIAAGGDLPLMLADACRAEARPYFVVALEGFAPDGVQAHPHVIAGVGQAGRMIAALKAEGCREVVMAGRMHRPDFRRLKVDWKGALLVPRFLAEAGRGDDALFRVIVSLFASEGIAVVGPETVLADLVAPEGAIGRLAPGADDMADIARAFEVTAAMGALDIGQAVAVARGLVLAVEAAEGTDAMIARIATLPEDIRGTSEARRGVLLKASKPRQERRVDLPAIGPHTIEAAARAGLAGVAVEAGAALMIGRAAIATAADAAGLWVAGVKRQVP